MWTSWWNLPLLKRKKGIFYPETLFSHVKCQMKPWKNFEADNAGRRQ
jgi:hypothetical protein